MALRSIKSLLPRVLKKHGITQGVEAAQVVEAMEQEVGKRWGEEGMRGITVRYFRNNAVAVSCTSSVWAQEVKINEQEILATLKKKMGPKVLIERIRFIV
ncbi:MAG: DciA family protein [Patescibacteria group bacterium]